MIAERRLDGAVIRPPLAISCASKRQFSTKLYQIETLFNAKSIIVLPEGYHSLMGRIRNVRTDRIVRTCLLKYEIIVRRCRQPYRVKNSHLHAICSHGTLWGSKCHFKCFNGGQVSHDDSVVCEDDSEWHGDEPECIYNANGYKKGKQKAREVHVIFFFASCRNFDRTTVVALSNVEKRTNKQKKKKPFKMPFLIFSSYLFFFRLLINFLAALLSDSCEMPLPPNDGKFLCDANSNLIEQIYEKFTVTNGTICHVECELSHFIPATLESRSIFMCNNGKWNSTMIEFCHRHKHHSHHHSLS